HILVAGMGSPSRPARPAVAPYHKRKSARELRQGGSDYRCCIPALAGFVSPQSIAPGGARIFPHDRHYAIASCEKESDVVDKPQSFCLHRCREMAGAAFGCCSPMLVYDAR